MVDAPSWLLRKGWLAALAATAAALLAIAAVAIHGDSTRTVAPVGTVLSKPSSDQLWTLQNADLAATLADQLEDLDYVAPPPTILGFLTGGMLQGLNSPWPVDEAALSLAAPQEAIDKPDEPIRPKLRAVWMSSESPVEQVPADGQPVIFPTSLPPAL